MLFAVVAPVVVLTTRSLGCDAPPAHALDGRAARVRPVEEAAQPLPHEEARARDRSGEQGGGQVGGIDMHSAAALASSAQCLWRRSRSLSTRFCSVQFRSCPTCPTPNKRHRAPLVWIDTARARTRTNARAIRSSLSVCSSVCLSSARMDMLNTFERVPTLLSYCIQLLTPLPTTTTPSVRRRVLSHSLARLRLLMQMATSCASSCPRSRSGASRFRRGPQRRVRGCPPSRRSGARRRPGATQCSLQCPCGSTRAA